MWTENDAIRWAARIESAVSAGPVPEDLCEEARKLAAAFRMAGRALVFADDSDRDMVAQNVRRLEELAREAAGFLSRVDASEEITTVRADADVGDDVTTIRASRPADHAAPTSSDARTNPRIVPPRRRTKR